MKTHDSDLQRQYGTQPTFLPARLLQMFSRPFGSAHRPEPDPARIAKLGHFVLRYPALRQWLLTSASETPRLQRALLHRAAQELSEAPANVREVLHQLLDSTVLNAVIDLLLQRSGLEPFSMHPPRRRGARIRLAELGERLETMELGSLPEAA